MDDATDEESPQSEQVYAANVKRCKLQGVFFFTGPPLQKHN